MPLNKETKPNQFEEEIKQTTIYYYYNFTPNAFSDQRLLVGFHWNLSDSKISGF